MDAMTSHAITSGARRASRLVLAAAGALAIGGPAICGPAWAADIVVENVRFMQGELVYSAPRVELRGTSLSQAEATRLLDGASPVPLAERVGQLSADTILVPQITSEVTTPQGRQVSVYRDVLLTKVGGGRIASVVSAGGTIEGQTPDGPLRGVFGRSAADDLDIGAAASLAVPAPGPNAPMKRLYGSFSVDGLFFTDAKGVSTKIARVSGRDFSARQTSRGWLNTVNLMAATSDPKNATPEARRAGYGAMAELFDGFAIGAMEATDISVTTRGDSGGKVARIAFTGAANGKPSELRMDGLDAGTKDMRTRLSSASVVGFSMTPMLEGLREVDIGGDVKPSPAQIRRLMPDLGTIKVDGLAVVGQSPGKPGAAAQPVNVSLGAFEWATAKPIERIPSEIKITLKNVAFAVPAGSDNDGLKQLVDLGYDKVDLSFGINTGWNEAGQELVVREISLDGAGMGSAVIRAVLGNVGRDVFDPDSAVATVAALGATAKTLDIAVEDRGLFEKFVGREARRQKRSSEDIRREYGMAAAVGIPAILGNSPAAKTLGQAVSKFVAKPGRLAISAKAKAPGGFGVADFSSGPDPASVLNALEITATAQ